MAPNEQATITVRLVAQDLMSGQIGKAIGNLDRLAQKGVLLGSVAQGVGQSFGQMLNPIGVVTRGIGVATDVIGDSIGAASDLAESMSKVNVVFGESADEIVSWSRTSASSVLLSQQAALEAVGTFGNLFDALDLAEQATVDMSRGAVQLAADLASFNNVPVDETLLAIRSGLLGEAEPMRKFGSALSAARVEAYALSQGWVRSKSALTEAMKVQARYELILQDTKNAQGDVARTSEGLANQQRALDANMENLSATIGQALVGPLAGFTGWLNDLVGPGGDGGLFKDAIEGLKDTAEAAREVARASSDPGSWALQGTIFDSAVDGLQNVADAWLDLTVANRTWLERMEPTRVEMGATVEDMRILAKAVMDGGGTYEDFAAIVLKTAAAIKSERLTQPLIQSMTGVVQGVKDAATTVETVLPKATETAVDMTTVALTSLRGAYKRAVADAKDFDRDWRHAIANPDKGEKTADQIESQMKRAMRRRNRALREGNKEAFAVADREVTRLQERLNDLEQRDYTIRVRMALQQGQRMNEIWHGLARDPNAGFRAQGGPVSAGMPYIVGERRAEVFVPSTNGTILPDARKALGATTLVYAPGFSSATMAEAQRFGEWALAHIGRAQGRAF